ncbi:MAG: energy transducer TonB [Salinibacter sp.]
MPVRKEDGADLRQWYRLFVEVGLTLALVLLVVAFQLDYSKGQSFQVDLQEQETVEMEEIQQTEQQNEPPPPPKPPVPVEVPNNETIENQNVDFSASLDLDQSLDTNQGPPAPEEEKEKKEKEIFVVVEQQPKCGGVKALQQKVEYPDFARKAGIEGRVFVQFVVNEKGKVTQPKVTRGVHKLLNEEALRAVKQLDCKPGMQRGDPVKVRMSLPVTFRLQ